jgi:amino-acid N-acetyltransferase
MQRLTLDILTGPQRAGARRLLESTGLPSSDLTAEMLEHFFFAGSASAPTDRSTGTGSALLDHAENYSRSRRVRRLFLLTTTADRFFARYGYAQTAREEVPDSIRSTREFAEICPASSILMVKLL